MGFTNKVRDKMAEMSDRLDEVRSKREEKKTDEGEGQGEGSDHPQEESQDDEGS